MSQYLVMAAVLTSILLLPPTSGDNPNDATTPSPNRIYYPNNLVVITPRHEQYGNGVFVHVGLDTRHHTHRTTTTTTAAPASCRYWCKTPQGSFYCCRGGWPTTTPTTVVVKPGRCPPVRPVCPRTTNYGPPVPCVWDAGCAGVDKCCFDVCLQQKVCKPPETMG